MSVVMTGTGSVTLPNPEFGDSEYNDQKNIVNRTRGGQVVMYPSGRQPTRRRSLTWRHLSKTETDALLVFMLANLGGLLSVNDHRSEVFNAIILTPDANISAEGREVCSTDRGRRSTSLELEVVL